MTEVTHASGFYPSSSDPNELRRAVTEQARAQERNVLTFKQHMKLIERLEKSNSRLMNKLSKIELKMAAFAGAGAMTGGGIVALIQRLF